MISKHDYENELMKNKNIKYSCRLGYACVLNFLVVSVMFVFSVEIVLILEEQSLAMVLYLLVAVELIASFGLTNPYDMPELNQQL